MKPSFFFTVPARKPRTLCCCHCVACMISSTLAPPCRFKSVRTCSCFVTRAGACGASSFRGSAFTEDVFLARSRPSCGTLERASKRVRRRCWTCWELQWLAASDLTLAPARAPRIARRIPIKAASSAYQLTTQQCVLCTGSPVVFATKRRTTRSTY